MTSEIVALYDPGQLYLLPEAVRSMEEAARRLGRWPLVGSHVGR